MESAHVVVIFADLAICMACFRFCPSVLDCPFEGRVDVLGILLTFGAFGILGLLEFVVCFGACGGLTFPGT